MVRFKGRISHFDFSFILIEKVWRFHDYTQYDMERSNFLELPEKRQLFGVSTVGEILGIGIWAEYAYNKMEISENFYELVVGIDYTFNFQTYVMAEYYRNTLGKVDYEKYSLNDWMRMMTQEQKVVARDQLYALARHPVTELMSLGLTGVYCISDKSFVLVPTMSYSLSDNVEVFAYLNFNFGKEGKVFAKKMGKGGLIRVRIYF